MQRVAFQHLAAKRKIHPRVLISIPDCLYAMSNFRFFFFFWATGTGAYFHPCMWIDNAFVFTLVSNAVTMCSRPPPEVGWPIGS